MKKLFWLIPAVMLIICINIYMITAESSADTYYQKTGSNTIELTYNDTLGGYAAEDGIGFISDAEVVSGTGYEMIRRHIFEQEGRYRILAKVTTTDVFCRGTIISVYKNGEKIWEQLFSDNDYGVMDIRVFAKADDIIDIGVRMNGDSGGKRALWSCDIIRYVGTLTSEGDTSKNYTASEVRAEYPLTSFISNEHGKTNGWFYSMKNDIRYDMVYATAKKRWEQNIPYKRGYIPEDMDMGSDRYLSYPKETGAITRGGKADVGYLADTVFEIKLPESGNIRIDGPLIIPEESDGVVTRICLNGELIWSSRVGGERAVRWDEPYDTSYFSNYVNVSAAVKAGDTLTFTFNQWRKPGNDTIDFSNVKIMYVTGRLLSDTTMFKLDRCTVADAGTGIAYKNDVRQTIDSYMENGVFCIAKRDINKVLESTSEEEGYVSLAEAAEAEGKTLSLTNDGTGLIYENISGFIGYSELSEISTEKKSGVQEINTEIVELNSVERTMKLKFSQKPIFEEDTIKMYNTNISSGDSEIILTPVSSDWESITYKYTGIIRPMQEYLIRFSEGESKLGAKLPSQGLYVYSGGDEMLNVKKYSDYENYINTKDVTVLQHSNNAGVSDDIGDGYGKSLKISKLKDEPSDYDTYNWNGQGVTYPPTGTGKSVLSFDVKPMRDDLHIAFELEMTGNYSHQGFNVVLDTNGNVLGNIGLPSDGWSSTETNNYDFSGTVIGKYKANEWLNIEMELDKPNKKLKLYLNGVFIKEYMHQNWILADVNKFRISELKHWVCSGSADPKHLSNIGNTGDVLMLLDNVKLSVYEDTDSNIKSVRFNDINGEVLGAFNVTENAIASVEVYFSGNPDSELMNSENIKLYYGNEEASYEGVYNELEKKFSLVPDDLIKKNGKVILNISDILQDFSTYIEVEKARFEEEVSMVNECGEAVDKFDAHTPYFVRAEFNNATDKIKTAQIMVAYYKQGSLVSVKNSVNMDFDIGETLLLNENSENRIEVAPTEGVTEIKIFAWNKLSGVAPLCEVYRATVK